MQEEEVPKAGDGGDAAGYSRARRRGQTGQRGTCRFVIRCPILPLARFPQRILDDESVWTFSIWGSVDGKKGAKVKEDENPVVVGEKEASGSGEKGDVMGQLPCMDRLREELSCAVSGGSFGCGWISVCVHDDVGE